MEDQLKKIMADLFDINLNDINEDTTMENIEAWDSLKHMELILAIEENFRIPQLNMDEIVEMISFDRIIKALQVKGL